MEIWPKGRNLEQKRHGVRLRDGAEFQERGQTGAERCKDAYRIHYSVRYTHTHTYNHNHTLTHTYNHNHILTHIYNHNHTLLHTYNHNHTHSFSLTHTITITLLHTHTCNHIDTVLKIGRDKV